MVASKVISGHRYWEYGRYYTWEEAYGKAMELKMIHKKEEGKGRFRYYIEPSYVFGDVMELFIPSTKYILWTN